MKSIYIPIQNRQEFETLKFKHWISIYQLKKAINIPVHKHVSRRFCNFAIYREKKLSTKQCQILFNWLLASVNRKRIISSGSVRRALGQVTIFNICWIIKEFISGAQVFYCLFRAKLPRMTWHLNLWPCLATSVTLLMCGDLWTSGANMQSHIFPYGILFFFVKLAHSHRAVSSKLEKSNYRPKCLI